MSPSDETELHRVSAMLAALDESLPDPSPLREGLLKAGLALSKAFIDGHRGWLEYEYEHLDDPLSEAQKAHLLSMGIDPDI